MKLKNKLTATEVELLSKIGIEITDKEYSLEEIIDMSDEAILNGEIKSVEDSKNDLAKQYANLVDKLIDLEDKD